MESPKQSWVCLWKSNMKILSAENHFVWKFCGKAILQCSHTFRNYAIAYFARWISRNCSSSFCRKQLVSPGFVIKSFVVVAHLVENPFCTFLSWLAILRLNMVTSITLINLSKPRDSLNKKAHCFTVLIKRCTISRS